MSFSKRIDEKYRKSRLCQRVEERDTGKFVFCQRESKRDTGKFVFVKENRRNVQDESSLSKRIVEEFMT